MNNEFIYKILRPYIRGQSGRLWKYEVLADYHVAVNIFPKKIIRTRYLILDPSGILTILKGYRWDGASGPALDTSAFMRGSAIHDALYQLLRLGLIYPRRKMRKIADKVLRSIVREDGMTRTRAFFDYWGLRFFGRKSALPDKA